MGDELREGLHLHPSEESTPDDDSDSGTSAKTMIAGRSNGVQDERSGRNTLGAGPSGENGGTSRGREETMFDQKVSAAKSVTDSAGPSLRTSTTLSSVQSSIRNPRSDRASVQ